MFPRVLAFYTAVLCLAASAAADTRPQVAEGVRWLHSFEYERALAAFERAEQEDPRAAMAYWGQALAYQQFIWGNENVQAARDVLARAERAGAVTAASPRERQWLSAAGVLFGEGERNERLRRFAEAASRIAAADPADSDAAALHGLAVLATASRGLAGAHHGAEERPLLVGSDIQQRAADIFTAVLARDPKHPGALHYLIHTWDDPANARKALAAAAAYPQVAPESSHARHMPAHIFFQLGMWEEAARSDEAAHAAAMARVEREGIPITAADFHPLSWLVYEYLQLGRPDDARRVLAPLERGARETNDPRLRSMFATLRSRVALASGAWTEVAGPDFVNYDELFAVGYSAAQRGDTGLAERARMRLADMAQSPRYESRRSILQIMALQIGAALRVQAGDREGALQVLQDAVKMESELPPPIGPPPLLISPGRQLETISAGAPDAGAGWFGLLGGGVLLLGVLVLIATRRRRRA